MDLEIEEIWVQKRTVGDFRGFVSDMYHGKSVSPKDSMERMLYKLYMNGGVHGKTITRTRRKERTFYDGVEALNEVVNEPTLQSTIGFTAMMNARARLLRHCRMVQAAGYEVMMCDTDSMVVRATEEEVRAVLGDAISMETKTMDDLGKLEFERDGDGKVEFDRFRCWGLKRYLESDDGDYRKSAFAGMKEHVQVSVLSDMPLDGEKFKWVQTGGKTTKHGKVIVDVTKTAKAENVWYDGSCSKAGQGVNNVEGLKRLKESKERVKRGIEEERILFTKGNPGVQCEIQFGTERQRKG